MALPVGQQIKYWSIAAAVMGLSLYVLGDVILPFLLGAAFAYFLDPVADLLERWGMPRAAAVVTITLFALLLFVLAVLLIIPTLIRQAALLFETAPVMARNMETFVLQRFPDILDETSTIRQSLDQLSQMIRERGGELVAAAAGSVTSLVSVLTFFVITPVVTFYLLLDWDRMVARVDGLLPRDHAPAIRQIARELDRTLAGFIRGQGSVCIVLGLYYALALMLVGLYLAWILFKSFTEPRSCPPLPMSAEQRAGLARRVLEALVPPLLLILAVLGSILAGIATPTESASVGAVGAMLLAAGKRRFSVALLREVMRTTLGITSMIFVILLGASVFSLVFRGLGGENLVHDALAALPGGAIMAVFAVMLVIFVLGFFLDTFEIIFIVVPIAAPALLKLGVDPIWLGVMIGVNLQASFLTPPFGFALFYLRGVAGKLVRTAEIYKGVVPFVALQLAGITLLWLAPGMATTLPRMLFTDAAPSIAEVAPAAAPASDSGSPVADDFSDLFDAPRPGRNPPYRDNFDDLLE